MNKRDIRQMIRDSLNYKYIAETKKLVVKKIEKSVELMDMLYNGECNSIELHNWFYLVRFKDNVRNVYYVSLIIERQPCLNQSRCIVDTESLTMTELKNRKGYRIRSGYDYGKISIYSKFLEACKTWSENTEIQLKNAITIRAQTSKNRQDYGCEWIGGGNWVEHTLYGDTTDFYITKIIITT